MHLKLKGKLVAEISANLEIQSPQKQTSIVNVLDDKAKLESAHLEHERPETHMSGIDLGH